MSSVATSVARSPVPWNEPLPFGALRSLDPGHDYLVRMLGFSRSTMIHFGVGFCTKGMMRGRVAIPIHNESGELVAYCGRRPGAKGSTSDRYPDAFVKGYELYNVHCAQAAVGPRLEGLILTGDYPPVWRLFECGWCNVVAVVEPTVTLEQLVLIDNTVGADQRLTVFFDWDAPGFAEMLMRLHGAFYVRVCRPPAGKRIVELSYAEIRKALANGA